MQSRELKYISNVNTIRTRGIGKEIMRKKWRGFRRPLLKRSFSFRMAGVISPALRRDPDEGAVVPEKVLDVLKTTRLVVQR